MEPPQSLVPLSVVMLPLPAQGHLNQLLHLSRRIASRGVPVHYVGSRTHNRQARDRVHGWDPAATPNVHFHDFSVPPFPTPPPNPNSPVKFPSHLQPSFDATLHLGPPLSSLVQSLSPASRRVVLIHDSAMSFASSVVSSVPNAEFFVFHSVSAFTLLFFFIEGRRGRHLPEEEEEALSFLPNLSFDGCFTEEFGAFIRRQHEMAVRGEGRLLNTCRTIEAEFVDRLALEPSWRGQRVFAIGPINPVALQGSGNRRHECLEWLDRHPPASVLYVSFGTTSSLSRDQILELASGLRSSGRRFVWVLRDADRGDIYASRGEEDRLEDVPVDCGGGGDRGLVVRGWAPQLEILAHPSTGGFLTHCGWNSCMESMSMGVPMLTWPMHSDQPGNALLVTEVLRTGIVARDWSEREEVFSAESVSASIAKLMESDQGKETAKRARAIKEKLNEAMADGGSSREDFDSFLDYMRR